MLIIDAHLDLAYNAMMLNRNLELEISEIRAQEAAMPQRGDNTVSLPELKRAAPHVRLPVQLGGQPQGPHRGHGLRQALHRKRHP